MHLTTFVTLLLSCRISAPASTLPIPTSDLDPLAQDPNHSYGLMTHASSHGFMTHGLKIQGSLPVDTQNTTAQGTQARSPSCLSPVEGLSYPASFRLGSGAVTPQSLFLVNEVSRNNSVDRYNIGKTFLSPRKEPGANTNTITSSSDSLQQSTVGNFPVVHPNPNEFRTTTSTVLYSFVETTTHPEDSFDNYGSSTMDEHAIDPCPTFQKNSHVGEHASVNLTKLSTLSTRILTCNQHMVFQHS